MAVETMQTLEYLRANRIDCFVDMHSHCGSPALTVCPVARYADNYQQQMALVHLTSRIAADRSRQQILVLPENETLWYNDHFFRANLGIFAFTYEARAGFGRAAGRDRPPTPSRECAVPAACGMGTGTVEPADRPGGTFSSRQDREQFWLSSTTAGMHLVFATAAALQEVPSPWARKRERKGTCT
jgi:hypothetical protein